MAKRKELTHLYFRDNKDGTQTIYIHFTINGKRIRKNTELKIEPNPRRDKKIGFRNSNIISKAEEMKRELEFKILRGEYENKIDEIPTILDVCDLIVEMKKKQKMSKSAIDRITIFKKNIENFGNIKIDKLDKKYILNIIDSLQNKKFKYNTINHYLNALTQIIRFSIRNKYISVNPMEELLPEEKIKDNEARKIKYLTFDEVKRISEIQFDDKVKNLFLFSCYCGLRVSDVLTLKWGDLKKENKKIFIEKQQVKTKNLVIIPLTETAQNYLPQRGNDDDFIFKMKYDYYKARLVKLGELANIKIKLTPHVSRHTFAMLLMEQNVNIEVVGSLLGHKKLETTQVYAKISKQIKNNAVDLIPKL